MKKCAIIAGSEIKNYEWVKSHFDEETFCIYCDGGLYHEEKLGVKPDLIIGDFDSHPVPETEVELIKLPTEKDDTDSVYAVKEAIKRGFTEFILIGAIGKRFDHSLGNMAILIMLEKQGLSGMIIDDYSEISLISGGCASVDKGISENNGIAEAGKSLGTASNIAEIGDDFSFFSVLPAGGDASGVTIEGAKYNVKDVELTMDFPVGISNEVAPGSRATVSVREGKLFIIKVKSEKF
ncbi:MULTISPECIES: thiamine diphosphokinase [unclassified Butyrivibrio]|uniref:thiamine diphosphokinase n=1 Tax=unclassified Butyrivibrio TaxID=2639466 RepID=UPI00040A4169|nr:MULTISPECIES: thiamine diphosphokinase [unclassified Butyrivibrio]